MKKVINVLVSLAIVLSFASCDNLQQNENGGNSRNQEVAESTPGLSITATIEGAKVNGTLVDAEGGKVNVHPQWEVGDLIYGSGFYGANPVCYKVVSVKDGVATFWWAGEKGKEPAIAKGTQMTMFYIPALSTEPYIESGNYRYSIDFSNQDGSLNSAVRNAAMHAIGTVEEKTDDKGVKRLVMNLDFKNITSLFKISGLKYPDGTAVAAGTDVYVTAEGGFASHAELYYKTDASKAAFIWDSGDPKASLHLQTVEENGTVCAYFMQPATSGWIKTSNALSPDKGIADMGILVQKNGTSYCWKSADPKAKNAKAVEAGKVYNLAKNGILEPNNVGDFVFGPGNLQYRKEKDGTEHWRFAENSYDMIGLANTGIDSIRGGYVFKWDDSAPETDEFKYFEGWIDMFNYGATSLSGEETESGYGIVPYIVGDPDPFTFILGGKYKYPAGAIADTQYDWGLCRNIHIEGDDHTDWRLLTQSEWTELVDYANNSHTAFVALYNSKEDKKASVYGMVFIPKVFIDPKLNFVDVKFGPNAGEYNLPQGSLIHRGKIHTGDSYEINKYTFEDWATMESFGLVFLPAAGERVALSPVIDGKAYSAMQMEDKDSSPIGCYWSSTFAPYGNEPQACFFCGTAAPEVHYWQQARGCSVRLVRPASAE